ncbi:Golgi apyrase [Globomyces sp. JEL0801]|nr:Golgi apyrase [Globomyces sp. JEL0801]
MMLFFYSSWALVNAHNSISPNTTELDLDFDSELLNLKIPFIDISNQKIEAISNWDENRQYGVVVDAGLSSFEQDPSGVKDYLRDLVDFAKSAVPSNKHEFTPFLLFATAGMRLVQEKAANQILQNACNFVSQSSDFYISSCERNFRIISGELEGILGWLTVNYLKTKLDFTRGRSYGFLDMGGASAQIAFEPTKSMAKQHSDDLKSLTLRYTDGTESVHSTFVSSFLGFGSNQARSRYEKLLLAGSVQSSGHDSSQKRNSIYSTVANGLPTKTISIDDYYSEYSQPTKQPETDKQYTLLDPCTPKGLQVNSTAIEKQYQLTGTGSFNQCYKMITPLLNKELKCPDTPCLFNGVHAPIEDFRNHQFLAVSEFWYTTYEVFDLAGGYEYEKLHQATENYCGTSWDNILLRYSNGYYKNVDNFSRLQRQCFKASYLMNVLHEGLGLPKTGSNGNLLESIDNYSNFSVSWTMGVMILYSSSTIPKKSTHNLSESLPWESLVVIFGITLLIFLVYRFIRLRKRGASYVLDISQFHKLDQDIEIRMPRTSSEMFKIL